MKLFFKPFFVLSFFIINVQVQANNYATLTPKEKLATQAVWKLQNDEGMGTGFFIAPKLMVTNFHIITELLQTDELKNINLLQETEHGEMESNIKVQKIIALSASSDLAILETNKSTDSYLNISTSPVAKKEALFALGYPQDKFFKISQIGPLQIASNKLVFPTNHSDMGGASGSPVLNDQNEVIGIVSSITQNFLHSIPKNQLKRLIEGEIGFRCENTNKITCIKKTIELTVKEAKKGDVAAQYQLGRIYLHGIGVEQNLNKSFLWLQKAAKQNDTFSQTQLGRIHSFGNGEEQNPKRGFFWTHKAAQKNYAPAQHALGYMYYSGIGVEQDIGKAKYWLKKSAKQGYTLAQIDLDWIYFYEKKVKQNVDEKLEWIQKAAKQNHAPAQYRLGQVYAYGIEIERDLKKSFFGTHKTAEQDYAPAQNLLSKPKNNNNLSLQKCRNLFR